MSIAPSPQITWDKKLAFDVELAPDLPRSIYTDDKAFAAGDQESLVQFLQVHGKGSRSAQHRTGAIGLVFCE
jgi:hypothetical protein